MQEPEFSVEYQYRITEFFLFISVFVYSAACAWFAQDVLQYVMGDWFFEPMLCSTRGPHRCSSIAFIVALFGILPVYALVRLFAKRSFFKDTEKGTLSGETMTTTVYGLSLLYALITLLVPPFEI